jgi:hypothetical protein
LKNGKNIYEIINTGIVSKDLLQKDLDAYRDEFSPIIERYLSKPNKSNEKSICEWLSSTNNLFMEIKRPWHNNSMSTYTNDEWNKLSIDLKKFENSFIPEYYVEIKKIADERKFYQEKDHHAAFSTYTKYHVNGLCTNEIHFVYTSFNSST